MLFKQILKRHHIEVKTVWTKMLFSPSVIYYLFGRANETEHSCSFHSFLGSLLVGSLSPLLQFLRGFVSTVHNRKQTKKKKKKKKASFLWGLNWSVWSCKVWYEVIWSICWQGAARQAVNLHERVKQDNKGKSGDAGVVELSQIVFFYLFIFSFSYFQYIT